MFLRSHVSPAVPVPVFVGVATHFERHSLVYLSIKAQAHELGTELLKKTYFHVPAAVNRQEKKGDLFTEVRTSFRATMPFED